jgi:hypothetical protein
MSAQPLSLFISYSHRDEALKEELLDHLSLLRRQNKILPWQDRDIEAGGEWSPQILSAFDNADIILLLISPRFMRSDFCYGKELERAMQRHRNGDAKVIPIILAPTDWKEAPFAKLKVLPKDGKPVIEWPSHDAAFVDVVRDIRRVVEGLVPAVDKEQSGWDTPPVSRSNAAANSDNSVRIAGSVINSTVVAGNHNQLGEGSQSRAPGQVYSPTERRMLFTTLCSLPGPQFSQLVFTLNPPAGNVPPDSSPQANRVTALLQWAESPLGPGLAEVAALLAQMTGPPQ